jgi:DNA modification methylase
MRPITKNTLFYGDNLEILQEYIPDESVDLIYLDPPFNSNRTYSVLFKDERGMESEAQINAFDDTWHWNERFFRQMMQAAPVKVASMLDAMHGFIGENQMMAYLVMMAARLVELRRVLKPTGSLYLHCDPTASHYLKVVLDTIFGVQNFRNEIIWKRSNPKSNISRNFPISTDSLLRYSKTDNYLHIQPYGEHNPEYVASAYKYTDSQGSYRLLPLLNPNDNRPNLTYEFLGVKRVWRWTKDRMQKAYDEGLVVQLKPGAVPQYKKYLTDSKGRTITNLWDDIIQASGNESLGYPTQKPLALLERILLASSNPGDIVLDPFSGCGTAIAAAQKLGRRWIGIDITHLAIAMHKSRLKDMFGLLPEKDYNVVGEPVDLNGAEALFRQNAYQFQWWAVSLIGAKPQGGDGGKAGKKGSDRGIDGVIIFTEDLKGRAGKILVQVKGGGVKSGDVRDLRGVIERENAQMGIFLTLKPSTSEMRVEADKAGLYHSDLWSKDYPRLQIVTVEELLNGRMPDLPRWLDDPHKKAGRVKGEGGQIEMEM